MSSRPMVRSAVDRRSGAHRDGRHLPRCSPQHARRGMPKGGPDGGRCSPCGSDDRPRDWQAEKAKGSSALGLESRGRRTRGPHALLARIRDPGPEPLDQGERVERPVCRFIAPAAHEQCGVTANRHGRQRAECGRCGSCRARRAEGQRLRHLDRELRRRSRLHRTGADRELGFVAGTDLRRAAKEFRLGAARDCDAKRVRRRDPDADDVTSVRVVTRGGRVGGNPFPRRWIAGPMPSSSARRGSSVAAASPSSSGAICCRRASRPLRCAISRERSTSVRAVRAKSRTPSSRSRPAPSRSRAATSGTSSN